MTRGKTISVGLLGCALLACCCLFSVFLLPGPFDGLTEADGGLDPHLPPSRVVLMQLAVDAGLKFEMGDEDLWWGGSVGFPEDDDVGPSPKQQAINRLAAAEFKRLEALTGTKITSGLGPRPPVVLKVGSSEAYMAQVNNRGGATEQATLELSGSALENGLVTVQRVSAQNSFAVLLQEPPDAGQPLVWGFALPIVACTANADDDVPFTPDPLFNAVNEARAFSFGVALLGERSGKGELLLRVRGKSSAGKGRLRRILVEVAP